jgi:hypothetical protein
MLAPCWFASLVSLISHHRLPRRFIMMMVEWKIKRLVNASMSVGQACVCMAGRDLPMCVEDVQYKREN